jgi:hypothetical protein
LPQFWKRYSDEKVMCSSCRSDTRRIFAMSWRVAKCVGAENIDVNAIIATVEKKVRPPKVKGVQPSGFVVKKVDYFIALDKTTPTTPEKLLKWANAKLPGKNVISCRLGIDPMAWLSPWFDKSFMGANFITRHLFLRQEELPCGPKDKLVKLDRTAATLAFKEKFPGMSHVAESIVGHVLSIYKIKTRRLIYNEGKNSLLTHKKGLPIFIRRTRWKPLAMDKEHPAPRIEVSFASTEESSGAQKLILELASGKNYEHYTSVFRTLLSGESTCMDLKLKAFAKSNKSFSRAVLTAILGVDAPNDPGDFRGRHGVLRVMTGKGFILAASVNGHRLWSCTGSEIPKIFNGLEKQLSTLESGRSRHAWKLQQLSADSKFEDKTGLRRDVLATVRDRLTKHANDRVNTVVEQITTRLASLAARHRGGFEKVEFDESGGKPKFNFPWYRFVSRLATKLKYYGITLTDENGQRLPLKDDAP